MPPGGGGGGGGGEGEHGYEKPAEALPPGAGGGEHGHVYGEPAAAHGGQRRDEEDPSRSSPLPPPLLPGLPVVSVEYEEENKKKQKHEQAEVSIPEDILMEILSRVPYRSQCRFKCVSRPWLALCSDRGVRKRSPQTLSGFFYLNRGLRFHNLSGKGPPMVDPDLPFLRSTYECFYVEQCSTSLLLCKCLKSPQPMQHGWNSFPEGEPNQSFTRTEANGADYVVCNPATQEWTSLPPIKLGDLAHGHLYRFSRRKYFLGFDPAVPSRFVVFVSLIPKYVGLSMTMFCSSETGGWTAMQGQRHYLRTHRFGAFLNGTMHWYTRLSIVTVDMKGNACMEIKMPPAIMKNDSAVPFVGQSQGRLYASSIDNQDGCQLTVWILENYATGQWNLKCTVSCLELIGRDSLKEGECYRTFAIHPDCDLIFFTDGKEKALSYDMTNQEVHVVSSSGDFLGGLPYIPCFAEWKSDGH
ncbi:unnamed protein product [Triticum turgidum subsp. durum]|uniref:F-box domain-containing protein n=1 Tax=Triticum turgidum subsp. durum TaxID=4567 RepID=A0A9R0QHL1_TRITD|nr:unnamed protein product [Triticum turgidum subsp. durum]